MFGLGLNIASGTLALSKGGGGGTPTQITWDTETESDVPLEWDNSGGVAQLIEWNSTNV